MSLPLATQAVWAVASRTAGNARGQLRVRAPILRNQLLITVLVGCWSQVPVVEAVQAMCGVASIVAVTMVAEVDDFLRFDDPRQLMSYLGLTPSEPSSGASMRRGEITKAGSGLARWALIESAWSYRMQARVSRKLHDRIEGLPKAVRDSAWKGQVRMGGVFERFSRSP